MKLNFKEWNIIYKALQEKAENIANNIRWQAEYEKDREEESDTMKIYKAEQRDLLEIIKRLENACI